MHIEISFGLPGTESRRVSKRKVRPIGGESRARLSRRLSLAVAAILAALLAVQVTAALTSTDNAAGLAPAEKGKASAQVITAQDLPITSPYQDNPISISGGGSMCLYR